MPKLNACVMSLLLVMALSSCASPPPPVVPVEVKPPRLAPPPPEVMVPRLPTFRDRLLLIFSPWQAKPTK